MLKTVRKCFENATRLQSSSAHRNGRQHLSTTTLSKGRHSAQDVGEKVVQYAIRREGNFTEKQEGALSRFRSDRIFTTRNVAGTKEADIFKAYFSLFDDMFFDGLLNSRCKVVLTAKDSAAIKEFGVSVTRGLVFIGKARVWATIRIHNPTHIQGDHERRIFNLGTLLHEMLHCFFEFYTCFKSCCKDGLRQLGKEHGFVWQDAAYALENSVRDPGLLNLPLQLARASSLIDELRRWDNPQVENLGRWGLSNDMTYRNGMWYFNVA